MKYLKGKAILGFLDYIKTSTKSISEGMISVSPTISIPWDKVDEKILIHKIVDWFETEGIFIYPKRQQDHIHMDVFERWYVIVTESRGIHVNNFLHDKVTVDDRYEILKIGIERACEYYNQQTPETAPKMVDLSTYDELPCPYCEKVCKPVRVNKNDSVRYKDHPCSRFGGSFGGFTINADGSLKE